TANKTMSKETNRISYPPGVNHVPRPAPRHNPYGIETYSIVLYIGKPGNFTGAGENILHRFQNFLLLPRSNTFLTGGKTLPSFHFHGHQGFAARGQHVDFALVNMIALGKN